MRTRVKVCGVTSEESAMAAVEAGADAVGFVFHPKSPRAIRPDEAFDISAVLPPFVQSVGVFVDESVDRFMSIEEQCPTDLSQLHGRESEGVVRQCGPRLIKSVAFDAGTIVDELARWDAVEEVDAILVDGSAAGEGGKGEAFDWGVLAGLFGEGGWRGRARLIVAGGLTAENVGSAIRALRPWAVDVSSGVESAPGVKDPGKLAAFCRAVREADGSLG